MEFPRDVKLWMTSNTLNSDLHDLYKLLKGRLTKMLSKLFILCILKLVKLYASFIFALNIYPNKILRLFKTENNIPLKYALNL